MTRLGVWWRLRQQKRRQTTWIYCPHCRYEMVAGGHHYGLDGDGLELYHCAACHWWSRWDFDSPVPVLRDAQGRTE